MNSIGVQSFAELYTLLLGWSLYGKFWTLLTQTGIAYLPFIVLVIRNFAKPYESQEARDAASTSLRRMELDLVAAILLILLGAVPCITLTADMVSYTPVCQASGQSDSYHPGNTGTSWDKAFSIPTEEIRVPIWWYAVLAISEGVTASANTMVGCTPDLRSLVTEVNMAQITDPTLKLQLQQFDEDCYKPMRDQYIHDVENNSNANATDTVKNDLTNYGLDDTEWYGSHGLQDAYYREKKATKAISGFPYDASQDLNEETHQDAPPSYGMPNCYDWWNDSSNGLKTRLSAVLPETFWDKAKGYFFGNDKMQDDVIKSLIFRHDLHAMNAAPTENQTNNYYNSSVIGGIGAWLSQLEAYPKLYEAAQMAPIIQSLLLMLVYTFLPIALVFSSYQLKSFVTGGMIIFSLIFWSFIWHLVSYADTTLMQAFYGDSWFSRHSPNATLADIVIGTLIIVAPLFWFSLMGAMGVAIGDMVNAVTALNKPGENAGKEGISAVKSAAKVAFNYFSNQK